MTISPSTLIEQWDIFELELKGPAGGNPFVDVVLSAIFTQDDQRITCGGFYDGEGVYRIRFMPERTGTWSYVTESNVRELAGIQGSMTCTAPSPDNHGPVRVHNTHHFAYADGTYYVPFGTTCYAWVHQGDTLETQTLHTLAQSPFNKMRMCVFPKYYPFNRTEPEFYPFQRTPDGAWDFTRFDPAFFQHLEQRVDDLRARGIEADLILFHPYDEGHWGFDNLGPAADDHYLRYVVARLAAFRNVWWSFANEYDLCQNKTLNDWERFLQIVHEHDPYQHLRSIHNWRTHYDHTHPLITHASIQTRIDYPDLERVMDWRAEYKKPIVVDETRYEGNIQYRWGCITPEEMVHRFWLGMLQGGYVGHGETYLDPDDILWWSKGGVLHGTSPARIAFLREIIASCPPGGLTPAPELTRDLQCARMQTDYYLAYTGIAQPALAQFNLPAEGTYRADIIDVWNMTITPVAHTLSGPSTIKLPGKSYMAVRFQRV